MRWKSRVTALFIGFVVGVAIVFVFSFLMSFFENKTQDIQSTPPVKCEASFKSIDEIIAALKSDDVSVRRGVHRKLFVRPALQTTYFDYERDNEYPERAENVSWQLAQLNDGKAEAVIRFARLENPIAVVLREDDCGWFVIAVFSSWLRFDDYPSNDWFELKETIERGVFEILLRESTGDAVSYVRKVRVLKLIGDHFKQIAEVEEERIQPFENYYGKDWSNVKLISQSKLDFENPGRIKINTTEEQIKFEGEPSSQLFFSETDGTWHAKRKHWRTRNFKQMKLIEKKTGVMVWDNKSFEFRLQRQ
jgi:hypothetical protein